MINKDEQHLRKICAEYERVENYEEAVADNENIWIMHHRNGVRISKEELERLGLYYNRPPGEFMFLTKADHNRLHNVNARPETRKKLSDANKGENHPFYGKHLSEEIKKKISDSQKGKQLSEEHKNKISENSAKYWQGKQLSEETKKKMSESHKCRHWYNNGKISIMAKECPEGFVKGQLCK